MRVWNSAGSGKGHWQVHVSTPVTLYFCVCLSLCLPVGWSIWLVEHSSRCFRVSNENYCPPHWILFHIVHYLSFSFSWLPSDHSVQVSVYTTILYFFKIHLIFPHGFWSKVCNTFNFLHLFTLIIMSYSNKGRRCETYQIRADFSAFHFCLLSLTNVNLVECLE
jgi:hypothetical protein